EHRQPRTRLDARVLTCRRAWPRNRNLPESEPAARVVQPRSEPSTTTNVQLPPVSAICDNRIRLACAAAGTGRRFLRRRICCQPLGWVLPAKEGSVGIVMVGDDDLPELLPLVRAYCDFYRVAPADEGLLELSRALIADPGREGVQLLARDEAGRA